METITVQRLIEIAREADQKLGETFNSPDVLPFAIEAIELIKSSPGDRPAFEEAFLDVLPRIAPPEFVEVCMHALRWSDVKTGFEARYRAAVERNDWRSEPVYRHYLEAFEDEWEDAQDFYGTYFGRNEL